MAQRTRERDTHRKKPTIPESEASSTLQTAVERPETEAYTTYLAHLVTSNRLDRVLQQEFSPGNDVFSASENTKKRTFRILDLCTGSGCIPLLLHSLISKRHDTVKVYGWDISETAIALAKENWRHNVQLGHMKEPPRGLSGIQVVDTHFRVVDIFENDINLRKSLCKSSLLGKARVAGRPSVDIIISNPPYISREAFRKETTRSVRNWEPKLALVPSLHPERKDSEGVDLADIFYHRLLWLHSETFQSLVLVMEIGDEAQAMRVAKMAADRYGTLNHIEIWKDHPDAKEMEDVYFDDSKVPVRGSGAFRAVALFRYK